MRRVHVDAGATVVPAVLAALTSWVALWSWSGFAAAPSEFLVPALGGALLVAVTGALMRTVGVPWLLVPFGQLAVVTVWLTHRWAADSAILGWIPTPSSLEACTRILQQGAAAAQAYMAPVSASVWQFPAFLLGAGVLVAVLVDLLACGLRRVPVAGLPLLAVYTAPVSILPDGVPWWVFAAGAIGFLALLMSQEAVRVQHWGRQVSRSSMLDSGEGPVTSTSMRISARRIGLTATTLAVAAPLVIPTFSDSLLPGGGPGGDGDGDSVSISNPMINLRRDLVRGEDVDLLRITSTDGNPEYLRISVLDTFDGRAWKPSKRDIPEEQRADGVMPKPPGLDSDVRRREVDYAIDVEDAFDSTWLPAPYPVSEIDVPGDWRYATSTFDFVSAVRGQDAAGLSYSLTALQLAPRPEQLASSGGSPQAIFRHYTDLPDDMPDTVTTLAREVTGGLRTRYEKAMALQRWFRDEGGFEYSLEPDPGTGTDDLEEFLAPSGRVGYCEQFSAAMALMGRTLGIPSRVAVGFLRADRVGDNRYVYSSHDLHAWPEMYFEGVGWVRFEPTPGDRARAVPDYTDSDFTSAEPSAAPSVSAPTTDPQAENRRQLEEEAAAAAGGDDASGGGNGWIVPAVLAGVLALLALPWLARTTVRRRRWSTAGRPLGLAEAGWRELRDTALDLRLPWDDGETLRTRARGVAAGFGRPGEEPREGYARTSKGPEAAPEAAKALERLVHDLERARYARGAVDRPGRPAREVRADVAHCVEAMRAGTSKQRRRMATFLPASLVRNGAWRAGLAGRGSAVGIEPVVDRAV